MVTISEAVVGSQKTGFVLFYKGTNLRLSQGSTTSRCEANRAVSFEEMEVVCADLDLSYRLVDVADHVFRINNR